MSVFARHLPPKPLDDVALELVDKLRYDRWTALPAAERRDVVVELLERGEHGLDGRWAFSALDDGAVGVAILEYRPLHLPFTLVPGALFVMGLSDAERERVLADGADDLEEVARYLEQPWPTRRVDVAPFLIACRPLGDADIAALVDGAVDEDAPDTTSAAHMAPVVQALAERHQLRLPTSAEWEHAARAGSRAPWPADVVETPSDPFFDDNAFALARIGELPELTLRVRDDARAACDVDDGVRADPRAAGAHVLRGGGGMAHPWQGCGEWLACLCAHQQLLGPDEWFVAYRPARSLFPDDVGYAPAVAARRAGAGALDRPLRAGTGGPRAIWGRRPLRR